MNKKGAAANALIGIITLLLIFWILFLPPAEREALLEGNGTVPDSGTPTSVIRNFTLLSAPVGHLAAAGPPTIDHPIPNIFLTDATEAKVLQRFAPFEVRNSWFDDVSKTLTFSIASVDLASNVVLSYRAKEHKGKLTITLNGVTIFDDRLDVENPSPLMLPKGILNEQQNTLTFSVSGVGIAFWSTNRFKIENAQITADVIDVNKREAVASFAISGNEYGSLDTASLSFLADCNQAVTGALQIALNNREIYNAIPDCDTLNRQDIFSTDLNPGKNTIRFAIGKGNVRLEQVHIRTEAKDVQSFLDFFEIDRVLMDEIVDDFSRIVLKIEFVDDGRAKQAIININGRLDSIDQQTPVFERDISGVIQPGNNYIEIVPRTELNIVNVDVTVE